VGKKRKATLLTHFKSIKKIRAATLEELSALPGINRNVAKSVKKALNSEVRIQRSEFRGQNSD
jgi:excinuclease ABC subunit C